MAGKQTLQTFLLHQLGQMTLSLCYHRIIQQSVLYNYLTQPYNPYDVIRALSGSPGMYNGANSK